MRRRTSPHWSPFHPSAFITSSHIVTLTRPNSFQGNNRCMHVRVDRLRAYCGSAIYVVAIRKTIFSVVLLKYLLVLYAPGLSHFFTGLGVLVCSELNTEPWCAEQALTCKRNLTVLVRRSQGDEDCHPQLCCAPRATAVSVAPPIRQGASAHSYRDPQP
jgi:hypothetical protein